MVLTARPPLQRIFPVLYHIPAEKEREDVSVLSPVVRLFQKTVDDLLLRLFLRQAQGHQLDELLPGNLADGGLVDHFTTGAPTLT